MTFMREMESDAMFLADFTVWRAESIAAGNDKFSEKGFYEAVLFDLFLKVGRYESFDEEIEAVTEVTKLESYKTMKSAWKKAFGGGVPDFDMDYTAELSGDQINALVNAIYNESESIFGSTERLNSALEGTKTVMDITNRISSLMAVKEVSDSRKLVLEKMMEQCESEGNYTLLKKAIEKVKGYYETNFNPTYIITTEIVDWSTQKIVEKCAEKMWGELIGELGNGWLKLIYTAGKSALNAWFSTSAKNECYMQMYALQSIEGILRSVTIDAREKFENNPTEENARLLNTCVEINSGYEGMAYEYSIDYLDVLDEAGVNSVLHTLGYPGTDGSAMRNEYREMQALKNSYFQSVEPLLGELSMQGKDNYDEVYSEYYYFPENFDAFCTVCNDVNKTVTDRTTNLLIKCGSVVATTSCTIGRGEFGTITIDNCHLTFHDSMKGQWIMLSDGQLTTEGNLYAGALRKMESDNDLVHVKGDLIITGDNSGQLMTAGTIKLEGDLVFDTDSTGRSTGFSPEGTCKTVFCGTELQTVKGKMTQCGIGLIDIQNPLFTMDMTKERPDEYIGYPALTLAADTCEITYPGTIQATILDLNGHNLSTAGTIDVGALTSTAKGGKVKAGSISASYITLTDSSLEVVTDKDSDLTVGSISLTDSTLVIDGDVNVSELIFSNGQLTINGDLTVENIRKMENESDILHVKGDTTVGCDKSYYSSSMTAGRVELEGNLTFTGERGFNPTNTCTTVFCGKELQTVKGQKKTGYLNISLVEINNPLFTMELEYDDYSHILYPGLKLASDCTITYDGEIQANGLDLNGHKLHTAGIVTDKSSMTSSAEGGEIKARTVTAGGIHLTDNALNIDTDVSISELILNNGQLTISGDFTAENIQKMENESDVLHVKGDTAIGCDKSFYITNMTAGRVELEGDLIFSGIKGFYPTNTCTTVFCGKELQTVKGRMRFDSSRNNISLVEINNPLFTMELEYDDYSHILYPSLKLASDCTITYDGEIQATGLDLNGHKLQTAGIVTDMGALTSMVKGGSIKAKDIDASAIVLTDSSIDVYTDLDSSVTVGQISLTDSTLVIDGDANVSELIFSNGQFTTNGDLAVENIRKMENESDILHVKGDTTVGCDKSYYSSSMTAGRVELEGNLTFTGERGFNPTNTCITVFCGKDLQTADKLIGAVVNAHENEGDLINNGSKPSIYIYDPEYQTGDRYMQLSSITANAEQYTYNGATLTPALEVKYGNITLNENEDYTISVDTTEGAKKVIVTGKGIYKGSKTIELDSLTIGCEEHNYGEWETVKEATCTENGLKTKSCLVCGHTETEEIPAGHVEKEIDAVEPTCTLPGLSAGKKCAVCGEILAEQEEIPALGHNFGDWETSKESTCQEKGNRQRVCETCGVTETEDIDLAAHDWESEYRVDVEPTCDSDGSESIHCKNCDATADSRTIPAVGHAFGNWISYSDEEHQRVCANDSLHVERVPHDWNVGKVTKEATETEEGIRTFTCTVCGETRTETIPVIAHTHLNGEPVKENVKDATCSAEGSYDEVIYCIKCGNELSRTKKTTHMIAHKWGQAEYKWNSDYTEVTGTHTCNVCGEKETATAKRASAEVVKAPTAKQKGEIKYTSEAFTDDEFKVQTRSVEIELSAEEKAIADAIDEAGNQTNDASGKADTAENSTDENVVDEAEKAAARAVDLAEKAEAVAEQSFEKAEAVYENALLEGNKTKIETAKINLDVALNNLVTAKVIKATASSSLAKTKKAAASIAMKKTAAASAAAANAPDSATAETYRKEAETYAAKAAADATAAEAASEDASKAVSDLEKLADTVKDPEVKAAINAAKTSADTSATTASKAAMAAETSSKTAMEKESEAKTAVDKKAAAEDALAAKADPAEEYGKDKTAVGPGASAKAAEAEITSLPNDNDPDGAKFAPLTLKSTKQTKTSIKLTWKKISGAKKYVIYGNACGKSKKLKKLTTSTGSSKTIKKAAGKKLKKGTYYKFIVVALNSNNKVVSTSRVIHVATKGKGNHTKVTTKAKKNKVSLKKGKTFKLRAKAVGKNVKKHVAVRYESTNPKVAKVSKSGKITAKKKGKCYVYVFAQNGVFKKIKVTVK
ncbi:MAG: Ig-like domain-containing protein [Mogibacterium sp.]|nr:Ig-like domain-containing protein [Mogibacterium sp.]